MNSHYKTKSFPLQLPQVFSKFIQRKGFAVDPKSGGISFAYPPYSSAGSKGIWKSVGSAVSAGSVKLEPYVGKGVYETLNRLSSDNSGFPDATAAPLGNANARIRCTSFSPASPIFMLRAAGVGLACSAGNVNDVCGSHAVLGDRNASLRLSSARNASI